MKTKKKHWIIWPSSVIGKLIQRLEAFHTYIFKEGKAKKKRNRRERIIAFVILISCPIALYYGFPLMGMIPLLVFGYIAYRMFKSFNKKLGLQKYGSKQAELVIAQNYLEFHDQRFPYEQLIDLEIYVDEYTGKPKFPFGKHHGGNNEIKFKHDGHTHNFNYLIESNADFKKVEKLVGQIELTYK